MSVVSAQPTVLRGDVVVTGTFSASQMNVPASAIDDGKVAAGVLGNFINPTKVRQQYRQSYSQPNTTATSERRTLHVVNGATGTLLSLVAGSIVKAVGAATVTVDLQKNGVSVLTSVITLDSSSTNRIAQTTTFSTAGVVVGDWLEIVITATAGGGTLPTGVFVELFVQEDPF